MAEDATAARGRRPPVIPGGMQTLIVGIGALGGVIGARLSAAGVPVSLAVRDRATADGLQASGLAVTGVGGSAQAAVADVAPLADFPAGRSFDLIVLATKAHEAMEIAPALARRLTPGGTLLPIQNGAVSRVLADRLGEDRVLGGLSNLGATMHSPGNYEQRNAGHLLVGELAGGDSTRARKVRDWLGQGLEVRLTPNLQGAIWSKLLLNCSVTTIGAVAGRTMREYVSSPEGRALFDRTYEETLSVARASGARPERMLVDPVPPARPSAAYDAWLGEVIAGYGDVKPSMLQDFDRGRRTEVEFINGYVAALGPRHGVPTPVNAAIVEVVEAITRRELAPDPRLLARIVRAGG